MPYLNAALLTVRGGTEQRGLVELARAGICDANRGLGGGAGPDQDAVLLVFDDGLGGFLPLSQADLACDPLSLASVGIIPAPSTLLVTADSTAVVKQTRRALYRHWLLAEGEAASVRGLLDASPAPDD